MSENHQKKGKVYKGEKKEYVRVKKVLLDTNFLLIPGQFKVDIFKEIDRIIDEKYQLFIIDKTLDELEKLIKGNKEKDKKAAMLGKQLIKNKKVRVINTQGDNVDDIIVKIKDKDTIVATQDKGLRKRLKGDVIVLRQKKYLKCFTK